MNDDQAKLTLKAVLTYDAEGMHSGDKDPEASDWFMFDVLYGGGLVLHDNKEIGDAIGTLSQVELVTQDDTAELRAVLEQALEILEIPKSVPITDADRVVTAAGIIRAALAASEGSES